MPLSLDIKKKLKTRTERVKYVDFHPVENWILSALYCGHVIVNDFVNQTVLKSIEVSQLPIRCAKFVARQSWIITAGDDMNIRVYNYNTLEKLKTFEAHTDYIRCLAIHPVSSYLLSASDDMTIKLWDWDLDWNRVATFEGHAHYVMACVWNPRESTSFASAALDRTIKVWGTSCVVGAIVTPLFSLLGHERGVNCLDYSPNDDRPYLVSGSDDKTVRIWDYQTRQCLHIMTGHTKNVSAVQFHPFLPIILSGSEDGSFIVWHASMYRQETIINNNMERLWNIAVSKNSNAIAFGYDDGTIVCTLGSDAPIVSMHGGKIVMSKNNEIFSTNIKLLDMSLYEDGERLPLSFKEMGTTDIFPQKISHHPNGRFIVVCGDGEYIIYTAQALRSKSYGKALDFVWSNDGCYAIRTSSPNEIILFRNFGQYTSFIPSFTVERLYGGPLLGLKSFNCICFYDWQECRFIRRIDLEVQEVFWSESSDFVCLTSDESFFILQFDKNAVAAACAANIATGNIGIEIAFELLYEGNEKVESALWIADSFIYVTQELILQNLTAGQIDTIAYLDRQMYLLNFSSEQNKLFLVDRELSAVCYTINVSFLEYLSAITRKDSDKAEIFLKYIPKNLYNKLAKFLEYLGYKEFALDITDDNDHKFDLSISLGKLQKCTEIIKVLTKELDTIETHNSELGQWVETDLRQKLTSKWRQLGDVALAMGDFSLSLQCFRAIDDFGSLLLLYTAVGDAEGLRFIAERTCSAKMWNLAFLAFFLLQDVDMCVQVLLDAKRYPEAAFFARTYCPSKLDDIMPLWKANLLPTNDEINTLCEPSKHPEKFANFEIAIMGEEIVRRKMILGLHDVTDYSKIKEIFDINLVFEIRRLGREAVEKLLLNFVNNLKDTEEERDLQFICTASLENKHTYVVNSAPPSTSPMTAQLCGSTTPEGKNKISEVTDSVTSSQQIVEFLGDVDASFDLT